MYCKQITLILQKRQLHSKGTTHYPFLKCSDENADIILIITRMKKLFQVTFFHIQIFQTSFQNNCFSLLKRLCAEVWEELYTRRKAGMRIMMLTIKCFVLSSEFKKALCHIQVSPPSLTEQVFLVQTKTG